MCIVDDKGRGMRNTQKMTKINQNIAVVRRIRKKSSSLLNEVFDIRSEKNENGQQSVRDEKKFSFSC